MKLKISINSGHIKELSGKELKKLTAILATTVLVATGERPIVQMNVRHNTTK